MTYIYGLTDPRTGALRYIGQTKHLRKRYSRHLNLHAEDRTHRACWVRGLLSSGLRPELDTLEVVDDAVASDVERFWIASLRAAGADLVNLTGGGEGGATRRGYATPADVRSKISRAHVGIRHTAETRALLSQQRRGKKQRPETVARRAAALRGRKMPQETRRKISAALMGHPVSEDTREKLRAYAAARRASEAMQQPPPEGAK